MLISIDPGAQTGVCIYQNRRIERLFTVTPLGLFAELREIKDAPRMIVIEDSRQQSFVFNADARKGNKAKAMTIARSIGRVDGLCAMIEDYCKSNGIQIKTISPKDKGAKLGADPFRQLTGYTLPTNQHERDAAMVGWRYR